MPQRFRVDDEHRPLHVGADSISARGGVKTPPYKASEKGVL